MFEEPLSERQPGHTRATRRLLASVTSFGHIMRIAAKRPAAPEPRTVRLEEATDEPRSFVPPPVFVDAGHVRIVRRR
jgi:hypothetical protein